jgi:purine-binding chemotaxis protein CheW
MTQSDRSELERRARNLAQPLSEGAPQGEALYLITFSLGEERYGLEVTAVREVQPLREKMWSPVPCTPGFVVGAVNIRGRIYSMMDVARFLGLPARPLSETAHVLLVEAGQPGSATEMVIGILADGVPRNVRVLRADVQPAAATISARAQDYVQGVTEDMLIILDLERLLSDPALIVQEDV